VELLRSIEPPDYRREKEQSLVLRLSLKNLSTNESFAPLNRYLVRERDLRPHDPYILTSRGEGIRLFHLAVDSEMYIVGQDFPVLGPGEILETIIAAEAGSAQHTTTSMTWRVQLGTGAYRSDMIGVEFTQDDVTRSPVYVEPPPEEKAEGAAPSDRLVPGRESGNSPPPPSL
jgi:hypothetical protein